MKISNYQLREIIPSTLPDRSYYIFLASVDVTTGYWFWKKTVTRNVYNKWGSTYYRFEDTGELTPLYAVENLARAYFAQNKQYEYA